MHLKAVRDRIRALELQYQRPVGSVRLLAVSKACSVEQILAAAAGGQVDFGENYLQEAMTKISQLDSRHLTWHFIGPVQSNKTRSIAQHFSWVHSLDRTKIAVRLDRHRHTLSLPPLNVCIQVNLDGETTKSGIAPEKVMEFAAQFAQWPALKLRGLMSLPRPLSRLEDQRLQHRLMRRLFDSLVDAGYKLDTLSMGTSNDMEAAIAEGTTLVRIGTALFGKRPNRVDNID